jgi:hypothetical protein
LNAAGRAGRAGEGSHGFVLVVPSKVVHFDNATNRIHRHWGELQAIFSQSDQCIAIEDPLTPLLDQIHAAAAPVSPAAQYLIRRLPTGPPDEHGDRDATARHLLGRSLGAFAARARNDDAWVQSRIDAVLAVRRADPEAAEAMTWAERLAAAAGVSVAIIRDLGNWLNGRPVVDDASIGDWREAVFDWLEQRPALIPSLLRREGLEGLLGAPYRRLQDDDARGRLALPTLRGLSREWMAGSTLAAIEHAFGTPLVRLGRCEAAREFVLRVVPELAYLFSLPSQIAQALGTEAEAGEQRYGSIDLDVLASCVREGYDRPEKLALRLIRRRDLSRVMVHRQFAELQHLVERAPEREDFAALVQRIRRAVDAWDRRHDAF